MTEDPPSRSQGDAQRPRWQIGEVAARTRVTRRILRRYEEKRLVRPSREQGVFRRYSEDDIARVYRIQELRDRLGFTLADVKDTLEIEDEFDRLMDARAERLSSTYGDEVDRLVETMRARLTTVEGRIGRLQNLRAELRENVDTIQGLGAG